MNTEVTLTVFQLISILIMMVILFLGYRELEYELNFKISKPYAWNEAVKNGKLNKALIKLEKSYPDKVRFYNLWFQIERLKREEIIGEFVELGVYRGESARIIHEMDPERTFRLFDTFSGFEGRDLENEAVDDDKYNPHKFADTSLERVRKFIGGNDNLHFYPGYFPETLEKLEENAYALIHLDADLYKPTLAALQYFYPRLSNGGVIILHDYNHNWDGLRKAVDEFSSTIREKIIEIPDWQGSAMIIKNARYER